MFVWVSSCLSVFPARHENRFRLRQTANLYSSFTLSNNLRMNNAVRKCMKNDLNLSKRRSWIVYWQFSLMFSYEYITYIQCCVVCFNSLKVDLGFSHNKPPTRSSSDTLAVFSVIGLMYSVNTDCCVPMDYLKQLYLHVVCTLRSDTCNMCTEMFLQYVYIKHRQNIHHLILLKGVFF